MKPENPIFFPLKALDPSKFRTYCVRGERKKVEIMGTGDG